jgi:hypothetical protein
LPRAPYLQRILDAKWLGEPVEIGGSPVALTEINNIRRALGALPGDEMEHLGEAEIIYHLQYVDLGAFFVTDDQPALDFARRRNVNGFDTYQIMRECYAMGEIGCPDAYEVIVEMSRIDRGVRVPANHSGVCP